MKKGQMNTDNEYDDEEDRKAAAKLREQRRRPVRNWKKVWDAHASEYDELDDFHTR